MLIVVLFLAVNVLMAKYHAYLIKKGEKILHGLWGFFYLVAVGFVFFPFGWKLALCLLFLRKWSFDLSLNYFRDLPLFYVSKTPKSLIDRLHNRVFGYNSEGYMMAYMAATIILAV